MTHQLIETRCAGTTETRPETGLRPRRLLHVLLDGPDGPTDWLIRLPAANLSELLRPARLRTRLAAISPVAFALALDQLAVGDTAALRRLGFTVERR